MKFNKNDQLIYDCYTELFIYSTPSGDFKKMMLEGKKNKKGQIIIPFNDYEIDEKLFNEIVNKYAKKLKYKWEKQTFKNTISLGCSPRFKKKIK